MIFDVGDLVKHGASAITFVVIDVTEEGMTLNSYPKSHRTQHVPASSFAYWNVVEGRPVVPRKKMGRRLDL